MSIYIGIDYSMTSPGICVLDGANTDIYAFYSARVSKSTYREGNTSIYVLKNAEDYKSQIERFDMLARKVLAILNRYELGEKPIVYIEGYSMGSRGQVFHIAENTAILKHYLFQIGIEPIEVAPTTIKKFASGSGKAVKDDMHDAFVKQTGIDLRELITPTRKLGSPVTDLVDSYFIACYAKEDHEGSKSQQKGVAT